MGCSCAYTLAQRGVVNEIVLLDIVAGVAEGLETNLLSSVTLSTGLPER